MKRLRVLTGAIVLTMALLAAGTAFATGAQQVAEAPVDRTGAWLDEVVFLQEASFAAGVSRLQAGEIQIYAHAIAEPELYRRIVADANLGYETSYGLYDEITFNPIGPTFPTTGKLNPFSVPRIREAMNWLINREFVAQEIYGGLANPRYTTVNTAFPDYTRLIEINRKIELIYGYDFDKANAVITEEMQKLGARKVGNVWQYNNEPVTLIGLIRTEDARRDIGDYVANQLERLGFRTQRDYKTGAEASPIWISGDPAAGLFHFYTGGWVSTLIQRDLASNFDFFYTPRGLSFPLWQAYTPSAEFDSVADRLASSDFQNFDQRAALFAEALELSMKDSVRIFVTDRIGVAPRRTNVAVAADLSGSISGAWLWGHTIRYTDSVGGRMTIGLPSMLPEPWNPIGGSNWVYDMMIIRATADYATLPDPYTGLQWPQRIDRAEVTIKQGLPVTRTHDWVTLNFANEVRVPADAWVDWDVHEQRFITVGTKHPEGLTANRRSIAYFEGDLLNRQWHDGSTFSVADMVMSLILQFDRANPDSVIFDESAVPAFQAFQRTFKGVRIVNTNPVVIEYYTDIFQPDAENNVATLFPAYGGGPGAWHTLTVGFRAEAYEQLAHTKAKADKLEVEWTNMIAGPSIEILRQNLNAARADNLIPYENTLGRFISAADARMRWNNLSSWVEQRGHFWVGLGPYYLERAFPVEKSAVLRRFENYGDSPEKWARFDAPRIADVDVTGPARVTTGQAANFDVSVTYGGRPYAIADMESVKYLLFNARGELVKVGDATAVADGRWRISLTAADTRGLPAGSNRLEIAVAPTIVSVPSFDSLLFATVAQ